MAPRAWRISPTGEGNRITIDLDLLPAEASRTFQIDPAPHDGPRLTVKWRDDADAQAGAPPIEITFRDPAGVTPSALSRFAWAKWMRLATTNQRVRTRYTVIAAEEAQRAAHEAAPGSVRPPRSQPGPGRPRRRDGHWERVRDRYRYLVEFEGAHNPVARIASEERVPRNTAAGWIRTLRERGELPPGRPGKPG